MKPQGVASVYEIDVDWDAVNAAGRLPTSGACPGCSMPLENILGAFAQDEMLAAAFSLHLLTFIAAALYAAYSYGIAHFPTKGGTGPSNFFGLRIALLLFVA